MASGYSWVESENTIYYVAFERLVMGQNNVNPNLACSTTDIIREPVGLITADEASLAGLTAYADNSSNYLYNNQVYWTMSPFYFYDIISNAYVFLVNSNGGLSTITVDTTEPGVRPVINLKADTLFTGTGTSTDPYIVVE